MPRITPHNKAVLSTLGLCQRLLLPRSHPSVLVGRRAEINRP